MTTLIGCYLLVGIVIAIYSAGIYAVDMANVWHSTTHIKRLTIGTGFIVLCVIYLFLWLPIIIFMLGIRGSSG